MVDDADNPAINFTEPREGYNLSVASAPRAMSSINAPIWIVPLEFLPDVGVQDGDTEALLHTARRECQCSAGPHAIKVWVGICALILQSTATVSVLDALSITE